MKHILDMGSVSKKRGRRRASKKRPAKRAYKSELLEARSADTRERILAALITVLNRHGGSFSIPAVAAEAGVAVPTVYRHFPNKEALIQAMVRHFEASLRGPEPLAEGPLSVDALSEYLRRHYRALDAQSPEVKAIGRLPMALELRVARRPARLRWFDEALADHLARFPEEERRIVRDVVAVLSSSECLYAFQSYTGVDAEEAAARAEWAVRALLASAPHPELDPEE